MSQALKYASNLSWKVRIDVVILEPQRTRVWDLCECIAHVENTMDCHSEEKPISHNFRTSKVKKNCLSNTDYSCFWAGVLFPQ